MTQQTDTTNRKREERNTFMFLAVFLAPILTVAVVGAYGFVIWISQIIMGPPGAG